MISGIAGTLLEKTEKSAIIDVRGVRYELDMSGISLGSLPANGTPVELWSRLISTDSSLTLYGFTTKDERQLFDLLITVNGVGPRVALNILGSATVKAIVGAIKQEQPEAFTKISRLGKKTASKIILDLKSKVDAAFAQVPAAGSLPNTTPSEDLAARALVELGYTEQEANTALEGVKEDDVSARVKEALKTIGKTNILA